MLAYSPAFVELAQDAGEMGAAEQLGGLDMATSNLVRTEGQTVIDRS